MLVDCLDRLRWMEVLGLCSARLQHVDVCMILWPNPKVRIISC